MRALIKWIYYIASGSFIAAFILAGVVYSKLKGFIKRKYKNMEK